MCWNLPSAICYFVMQTTYDVAGCKLSILLVDGSCVGCVMFDG